MNNFTLDHLRDIFTQLRKLVHFVGMRRSGNHAVINWVLKNAFPESEESTAIHLNDVYAPYAEPHRILRPQDLSIASSSKNLLVIFSYEDLPVDLISRLPTIVNDDVFVKNATKEKFLLLRDPFNTFASRLQRLRTAEREGFIIAMQKQTWPEIVDLWKSYAREYLGRTTLLGDKVTINYNMWVRDKGYRDRLLREQFGREENLDISINEVSLHGSGSSFDGLSYAGRGTEMETQVRWRNFLQDDFYLSLFRDRDLLDLSQEIFGHISGAETLYSNFHGKERM